jgi:hypothetical protein
VTQQILVPRFPILNGRPVVICTGCAEAIPAPRGKGGQVQCQHCGKRITVVNIQPAGESSRAC